MFNCIYLQTNYYFITPACQLVKFFCDHTHLNVKNRQMAKNHFTSTNKARLWFMARLYKVQKDNKHAK